MKESDLLLNRQTREQLRTVAATALAVLPVGSTEQHGPHLPVGTDTFAVEAVARRAALAVAEQIPIVVAPTLPFGSSQHHLPFGGTMSLGTETYYRVIRELVASLIGSGFRRVLVLNGHGGNQELVELAVRDLALKHPVALGAAPYWRIAESALTATAIPAVPRLPGHAGAFETSLVMALAPEFILEPRPHRARESWEISPVRSGIRREYAGTWQRMDGYTDSPDLATAEAGAAYLEAIVGAVGAAFVDFYHDAGTVVATPAAER